MRTCLSLIAAAALCVAAGCGPRKSEAGKKRASNPPKPSRVPPGKTSKAAPEEMPHYRKVIHDLVHERIPGSPVKKDGLEAAAGWKAAGWEDAATYKRLREKKTGLVMFFLGTEGGEKGKCAAVLTRNLCLAPKGSIKATIFNYDSKPAKVAFALWFSNGWVYYESKPRTLEPGRWQQVEVDLAAGEFKTASTKWKYTARLWKREDTRQIALLLYHQGRPARLLVDGITVDQAPRPKPARKKGPPPPRARRSGPPPKNRPVSKGE